MRVLLVCSSGGHLYQLYQLKPWWTQHDRIWVSFDKPDAESLLSGEEVVWAHHPTTRNIPNLLRNFRLAARLIRRSRPDVVITDGAGVGLPFMIAGKLLRSKTVFIEVFDRQDSLTGKLARPFVDLFLVQREAQLVSYPAAELLGPILFNPDVSMPGNGARPQPEPGGVFVTVGTDHHAFDRLMAWCSVIPADGGFVQHGPSVPPPGWEARALLTYPEMVEHIRSARVVVTHGGPATVALCLALGKWPIVVPRRGSLGEVVDDHQVAFAERLTLSGHARVASTPEHLRDMVVDALVTEQPALPDLSLFRADESVLRFERLIKELVAGKAP